MDRCSNSMRGQKLHAAVARSTFWSQMLKKLSSGALLEVEMSNKCTPLWHEADLQGKNVKNGLSRTTVEIWDVEKHMPLWCEAHLQLRNVKNWRSRTTFGRRDVENVHAVVARSTFACQKCEKLTVSDHFCTSGCRKSAHNHNDNDYNYNYNTPTATAIQLQLHYTTPTPTPTTTTTTTTCYNCNCNGNCSYNTALNYTRLQLHYATLHYTTLH